MIQGDVRKIAQFVWGSDTKFRKVDVVYIFIRNRLVFLLFYIVWVFVSIFFLYFSFAAPHVKKVRIFVYLDFMF